MSSVMLFFTANESAPDEMIPCHHEMSESMNPPRYVLLYCQEPPRGGGENPLMLSHEVYKYFSEKYPEEANKLEELGVRYIRLIPNEDDESTPIGRSWKNTFHVSNKDEAEDKMRSLGYEWDWMENDNLKTISGILPAIRSLPHPDSSKFTFFNAIVAAFQRWIDERNSADSIAVYGDFTEIPVEMLKDIHRFIEENQVTFPWKKGDILLIDNFVTMHGRKPFSGGQRILVMVGSPKKSGVYTSSSGIKAKNTDLLYRLPSGDYLPRLGLGFWKVPKDKTPQLVVDAIRAGIRNIDSACDYTNEKEIGEGIKQAIEEGIVKREDLFIASKLWNTYHGDHVEQALNRTLSDLQLTYVDLYLIHFPIALKFVRFEDRYPPQWVYDPTVKNRRVELAKVPLTKTWRNMEKMVVLRKARNIGVSNFNLHPYLTQEHLVEYCQNQGICIQAYSPFGPAGYFEIGLADRRESLEDTCVKEIAEKHGKSIAVILLRWALQRGTEAIFKSKHVEHIKENLQAYSFELSNEEMESISNLNRNRRYNDPSKFGEGFNRVSLPIYE